MIAASSMVAALASALGVSGPKTGPLAFAVLSVLAVIAVALYRVPAEGNVQEHQAGALRPKRYFPTTLLLAVALTMASLMSIRLNGHRDLLLEAPSWFSSGLVGALLTYPLVLAAAQAIRGGQFSRRSWVFEWAGLSLASVALAYLLFFRGDGLAHEFWPTPYLAFPLLIWAAVRLGVFGASSSLFLFGMLGAAAEPSQLGPIARLAESDDMRQALLQVFFLLAGISTFVLADATDATRRAMQSLEFTEGRYRNIFEGASDAIFLIGSDGACIAANPAACELTGFTSAGLIGKRTEDLIAPEDLAVRPSKMPLALQGVAFVSERQLVRKDERRVSVEISVKPLPDGRLIAILRDLTERKRQEAAIRAILAGTSAHVGEAFFGQLVQSLAEALDVIHAHVGELVDPEAGTVRMLAVWTRGEERATFSYRLAGTPCETVFASGICHCAEGVQERYPSDTMLGQMGAVSYLGLVIRDRFDKPIGLLAVLDEKRIEATEPVESILRIFAARAGAELERLRSEAALRESEMRQRALLEAFPDSLFVMNLDGTYLDYHTQDPNRLRLPPEEFIGKTYRDVMPPELHADFDRAFEDMRAGRRAAVFEYESPRDGFLRHFEVRHSHAGEGLVLAILRDVTLRREYDEEIQKLNENLERLVEQRTEQLAAANRELESFAYSVSHDLRAPLRGIHANASILREDLGPKLDPGDAETLNRIVARATEMSNLIDGLLKISRIMRAELQRETIDLSLMAHEAWESVVRWHPDRRFDISIEAGMEVRGDRVLLLAALTNLFDNAVKFTVDRDPAKIVFGSRKQDGERVFFVSDNGVGFNMEHAGKLFRPFERLHTQEEFAGTGIGLATVHRVVQRHGGRIWADGKVGEGATFFFTLSPGPVLR